MKRSAFLVIILFTGLLSYGQKMGSHINQFIDFAATIGNSRGTMALSYVHNWKLGKKEKWEAGLGVRFSSIFGTKQDYTTAPARLARSTNIPFIIVFAGQETQNWDTLTVQRPLVNSFTVSANFCYNFNSKWSAGFNIDLIGLAVGRKSPAILISNGVTTTEPAAKPANFNVLLTGDLDYGNLNSEFFFKYRLNGKWGIRAVYQFFFSEYKTTNVKQIAPDGTEVTRFRMKANNFGLGISYNF